MKNFNEKINNLIRAMASARAGFIFAFFGMLTQSCHTWFISFQFSSFEGWPAGVVASFMAIFLGGGLMFYTIRSGNAESPNSKRNYNKKANFFMAIEIFINLYYWLQKIIFIPYSKSEEILWFELIIVVPFSVFIPVILKTYGGEIKLTELDKDPSSGAQTMRILEVDSDNREYKVEFK